MMIRLLANVPRRVGLRSVRYIRTRHDSTDVPRRLIRFSRGNLHSKASLERATATRLSIVSEIFDLETSFQRAALKISHLYNDKSQIIFDDLRNLRDQAQVVLELCRGFALSRSMRGFYLDQLFQSIARRNFLSFIAGVQLMKRAGFLGIYERVLIIEIESACNKLRDTDPSDDLGAHIWNDTVSSCLDLLIRISISSGEPLVGALFSIHSQDSSIEIKTDTLERVILGLSISDSLMDNYHSFAIFKVLSIHKRDYRPEVITKAIKNMCSGRTPYFANLLHDIWMCKNSGRITPEMLEITRKALIAANIAHGNYYRAADLWKSTCACNPAFGKKNIYLFRAIVEKMTDKNLVGDLLLNHFPESLYTHPDFVDFTLSFFGQNDTYRSQFDFVTRSLKPPLKRNMLSLLFASFISQNREEAAEKILQVIFKTKNGINTEDFLIIINKLLAKNLIRQCVEMCLMNDFRVSYKGAMKVMEYFLLNKISPASTNTDESEHRHYYELRVDFLSKFTKNLYRRKNELSVYRLLTTTLIRHFSAHIGNRPARKLYLSLSYTISRSSSDHVNLLSYDIPSELGKFLLIDNENRILCLEIILRQAQKENDDIILDWCASELHNAGVPVADIKRFFMHDTSVEFQ